MELTNSEIAIADRYITRRERQLAQWPLLRWLLVIIFSVGALVGYRNLREAERSIQDDKAVNMELSQSLKSAPPPGMEHQWTVGSMMKICKILELRHQVVSYSLMQGVLGYVEFLAGTVMVFLTIFRWKTGERDALICKLLRAKLQELQRDRV